MPLSFVESLLNDSTAKKSAIIGIDGGPLTWGDGFDDRVESQSGFIAGKLDGYRIIDLAVSEFGDAMKRAFWTRTDPVKTAEGAGVAIKMLIAFSASDIEDVVLHVFLRDEPSGVRFPFHTSDAKAFPLADRVIKDADMLTEDFAVLDIDDFAIVGREIILKEFPEMSLSDEANAGRAMLLRDLIQA